MIHTEMKFLRSSYSPAVVFLGTILNLWQGNFSQEHHTHLSQIKTGHFKSNMMLHRIGRINHLPATEPSCSILARRRHQTYSPCPPAYCFPWRDRDGLESRDWPLVVQLSVESILITPATSG